MNIHLFATCRLVCLIVIAIAAAFAPHKLSAQNEAPKAVAPLNWTTQQDHQNMKDQLSIVRLRPGAQ